MTDQADRLGTLGPVSEASERVRRTPAAVGVRRAPGLRAGSKAVDLIGLATLLVVLGFLWGRAAGMSFWLDEGISVGVASHSLRDIPHVLLQDGSPPLYYLLLNGWTSLFGASNSAVHLLSLLFGLATVPAAFWAGWSLFDRRTGWMCALVVAINPFVAYYATEARMYSMATMLAVVATACFLHAFVLGRRRYLPWFVLFQSLLLYTHNWGILLSAGAAVALLPLLVLSDDRRRLLIDAVLGFGGLALLYAPWVPSITYQVGQKLQPWGRKGDLEWVRDDVARMMGGKEAFLALGLGAGIGLAALVQSRGWRTRQAMAAAGLALIPFVALAVGWTASVWAYRYLAVIVAPVMLLAAIGLARGGRMGLAALGVAAFLSAPLAVKGPPYQKSNAEAIAAALSPQLQPGDLLVLPDFQMVPLVAHYLPGGMRYATASGLVPDKDIVDWRDSMGRLRNDDPAVTLPPLIAAVPPGGHVLVLCPAEESGATSSALAPSDEGQLANPTAGDQLSLPAKVTPVPVEVAFHPLILLRCHQTQALVANDPDLQAKDVLTAPPGVRYGSVGARLFVKRTTGIQPG